MSWLEQAEPGQRGAVGWRGKEQPSKQKLAETTSPSRPGASRRASGVPAWGALWGWHRPLAEDTESLSQHGWHQAAVSALSTENTLEMNGAAPRRKVVS